MFLLRCINIEKGNEINTLDSIKWAKHFGYNMQFDQLETM